MLCQNIFLLARIRFPTVCFVESRAAFGGERTPFLLMMCVSLPPEHRSSPERGY